MLASSLSVASAAALGSGSRPAIAHPADCIIARKDPFPHPTSSTLPGLIPPRYMVPILPISLKKGSRLEIRAIWAQNQLGTKAGDLNALAHNASFNLSLSLLAIIWSFFAA